MQSLFQVWYTHQSQNTRCKKVALFGVNIKFSIFGYKLKKSCTFWLKYQIFKYWCTRCERIVFFGLSIKYSIFGYNLKKSCTFWLKYQIFKYWILMYKMLKSCTSWLQNVQDVNELHFWLKYQLFNIDVQDVKELHFLA